MSELKPTWTELHRHQTLSTFLNDDPNLCK